MNQISALRDRPRILGCRVDPVTMEEAIAWCIEACRAPGRPRILLTANASHLVEMQDNPALAQAADRADFTTADGKSLVWAGRFLGHRIPERVAGCDLMEALLARAPRHGIRIFFLGARPEVVEALVATCRRDHPGIEIAGHRDGYFTPAQHDEVVRQVAASRADLLLVAMPSPFKDVWCEARREDLGVRLIIGVGGSFDVMTGRVRRAPRWMQQAGLEWAWRLLLEPRRLWRRYLVGNARFVGLVLRQKLSGR